MKSINPAVALLGDAKTIVTGARNKAYGKPEDNFARIASFWYTFKGVKFTSTDVAAMLALLKIARLSATPDHRDSVLDLAGYAACYERCRMNGERRSTVAKKPQPHAPK